MSITMSITTPHRSLYVHLLSLYLTTTFIYIFYSYVSESAQESNVGMLLPHMVFAALWEHHRDKFFEVLVPGGHATLESFWQVVSGGPTSFFEL